jgi:Flp pilus assembly protein TadD
MAWLAFRRGHGQRLRAFGASWFLLAFLPISNLVDLNATVAEHWLYLPSVGFLIFIAGCMCALPRRYERAAVVIAGLAVIGLGARSFVRSTDWVDPATFYQRTAEAGGTSCRVAVNLAQIYITQGQAEKAEHLLRNVLKTQPDYTIARNNLADALIHLGKKEEAEAILKDATAGAHRSRNDYPRTWIASMNFARSLDQRGDAAGALAVIEKARVDYPNTWELISCQSELLRRAHKIDDAIKLVGAYAEAKWWHYGAAMAMGRLLAEKGEANLAENALSHAAWLDVRSTEALNLIALIRIRENRLPEALQSQHRAVARQPEEPRQYILLSDILEKMGRGDEARLALAQVTRLRTLADSEKLAN